MDGSIILDKIHKWETPERLNLIIYWFNYYKASLSFYFGEDEENILRKIGIHDFCIKAPYFLKDWVTMMCVSDVMSPLTPAQIQSVYCGNSNVAFDYWRYREKYTYLMRQCVNGRSNPLPYEEFDKRPASLNRSQNLLEKLDISLRTRVKWEDYRDEINSWAGTQIRDLWIDFLCQILIRMPIVCRLDIRMMRENLHNYFLNDKVARYAWLSLMICGIKEFVPKNIPEHIIWYMWEEVNHELCIFNEYELPKSVVVNYLPIFTAKNELTIVNSPFNM